MGFVNILFLSDLHFKSREKDPDYAQKLKECSKIYIDGIRSLPPEWKPQIVAIAGDIGYEGKAEDYSFFDEAFFSPLVDCLGIDISDVILCPGNHDKDDSRFPDRTEEQNVSWRNAASEEKIVFKGYRAECREKRFVLDSFAVEPFQNYIDFLREKGIPEFNVDMYDYPKNEYASFLYGYRHIKGLDFYVYNSAWDCLHYDKMDKGNLRIGPIRRATSIDGKQSFSISLVHHPKDWLSVESVSSFQFRREEIENQIEIAVHGHMHTADIFQNEDCDVLYVQLPTWASADTDFLSWMSYIIKVNLDDFTYSRMSIFWRRENAHIFAIPHSTDTTYQLHPRRQLDAERRTSREAIEYLCRMLKNKLEKYVILNNRDLLREILDLIIEIIRLVANSTNQKMISQIIDTETIVKMKDFHKTANTLISEHKDATETEINGVLVEEASGLFRELERKESQVLVLRVTPR